MKAEAIVAILTYFSCNALTLGETNVYENFHSCPPGKSGPDCLIRYEICPDGKRKCFNNSQCVRNNKLDPVTMEHGYHCDCSAASDIDSYAGHECEYQSTAICNFDEMHMTSFVTFCTNGGICGTFTRHGHNMSGCNCPKEYEGAHCQYLQQMNPYGLEGEVEVPEVAPNFYTYDSDDLHGSGRGIGTYVTILIVFIAVMTAMYATVFFAKKRGWNTYFKHAARSEGSDEITDKIPPETAFHGIQGTLEADGSGTMLQEKNTNDHKTKHEQLNLI